MDRDNKILDEIPQAAQSHLNMLQAIIQRMSTNCTSCKTWCVTLVSGLMVVLYSIRIFFPLILVAIFLVFIFGAYYLSLEKRFRDAHNSFIKKMHEGTLVVSDLFVMAPSGDQKKAFFKAMLSFSVWPFYITLFLLNFVILVYFV